MKEVILTIDGMGCDHCVATVDRSLRGVAGVQVDAVAIGSARIVYDAEAVPASLIREAVEAGGYPVRKMEDAP